MNLSKSNIKLIVSLQQKKYRQKHKLFVAEGVKVVQELLESSFILQKIFVTDDFNYNINSDKKTAITEAELQKISQLKTPNKVLGLFQITENKSAKTEGLILALDKINNPGNLGTIIRLCDWFGISKLVCSTSTVDCFNQKVVQSSMGSLARVDILYVDLPIFLQETDLPIYSADMNGKNVYKINLPKDAILLMGNEANGISKEIMMLAKNKISIPRFGGLQKAESLNVATATAILLNEFRRC